MSRTKKELEILAECRELKKKHPKLKRKKLDKIKDLEKRLYYHKVWAITESQPLHKLRNHDKRCFRGKGCFHLDHRCPIIEGFNRKIPPEVIGGMPNLRFIPAKQNMDKGHKVRKNVLQETLKKSRNFKRKR
jgi:hypothetical protein